MFGFKRRRRNRLRNEPLPASWLAIIERNLPYLRLLTDEEREQLQGDMQIFLAEKRFVGAGGLAITDEVRVTIAAQACILLLNRDSDFYPSLVTIVVYPRAYQAPVQRHNPDGTVTEGVEVRGGESWHRGQVVLSWDGARRGAADIDDGHNLVYHEFAHQLDSEAGTTDGAPKLPQRSMYTAWAQVLGKEYEELNARVDAGEKGFIRAYGATNPAEFFAVITELFFERPVQFEREHPELYEQLQEFYRQDPAARLRRT